MERNYVAVTHMIAGRTRKSHLRRQLPSTCIRIVLLDIEGGIRNVSQSDDRNEDGSIGLARPRVLEIMAFRTGNVQEEFVGRQCDYDTEASMNSRIFLVKNK